MAGKISTTIISHYLNIRYNTYNIYLSNKLCTYIYNHYSYYAIHDFHYELSSLLPMNNVNKKIIPQNTRVLIPIPYVDNIKKKKSY